jgi:hypothetical protein
MKIWSFATISSSSSLGISYFAVLYYVDDWPLFDRGSGRVSQPVWEAGWFCQYREQQQPGWFEALSVPGAVATGLV